MRPLTRLAGALAVAVGLVHLGVGFAEYERLSFDALWFGGSGLAVVLIGALTLLGTSDCAWKALSAVAVTANLVGLALAVAFGSLSRWREPQGPTLVAIFATSALGCVLAARGAAR